MKYAKLKQIADGMTEAEAADSLRSLVSDNRFAAVLRLVQQQKELASDSSCQLKFADSHGCLAHAAGVRYGMLELEGRLRGLCEQDNRKRKAESRNLETEG
jgi:hypothetical protein